jgi:DNA-binding NarL/FixJ family response regulator
MSITVFLADDHSVLRGSMRVMLEVQPEIKVVGEAGNGRETVRMVSEIRPDVVLMDIAMPELNGIEATRMICESCPTAKVVVLSMHSNTEYIFRALQAGAHGYLLKDSPVKEVKAAIRTVHAGQRYLSQSISDQVIQDYVKRRETGQDDLLMRLSSREREVLQLIVEGRSTTEIAELVCLSPKTVETYRSRLMKKLGISNLPDLVKFAIQHGLTTLE